jgi:hypothetical protein
LIFEILWNSGSDSFSALILKITPCKTNGSPIKGLFSADSSFFDGNVRFFGRIGSNPFSWRILKISKSWEQDAGGATAFIGQSKFDTMEFKFLHSFLGIV